MRQVAIVTTLLGVLLLSALWVSRIEAQVQDNRWSTRYRLSSEEGEASGATMVADAYGYVHVFWTETGFPNNRSIIQYARFDGETWSGPIDIYATWPGVSIGFVTTFVDQEGILHLAWTEGNSGPVFYANAPAHNALSAQQWRDPVRIDAPAFRIRLRVDSAGAFHMLYSEFYGEQPGIYYQRSQDGGTTWSEPHWLDPDIPPNYAPPVLQFAVDETDGLHAVWYYIELDVLGAAGRWVRYAHSLDGGDTWSAPFTIDRAAKEGDNSVGLPYPGLIVQDRTVHVIWTGGDLAYKNHLFSTDAGQTWGAPNRKIFGDLHGQALGDGLAVDTAGRMHYVGLIRWPMGLYHAYWDQGRWTVPSLFYLVQRDASDLVEGRIAAHHVRLAIRAGNQPVVTFTTAPGSRQSILYEMHRTLDDIPSLPEVPTPASTPTPTLQPSPTPTPFVPTPTPKARLANQGESLLLPNGVAPVSGLLWGLVPSLLLVAGTTVFRLLQNR